MRIVSQNGGNSIEFDGTEIFVQYENICYQSTISKGRLGAYADAARTLEVFSDMHKQWREDPLSVFNMPET